MSSTAGDELTEAEKLQNKGPAILWICWIFSALATLFVIARLYVRYGMMRQLHGDDWFVVGAVLCGIASAATSTIAVSYGGGKHMGVLTTDEKSYTVLWTLIGLCPGIFTIGLPKLAVAALLSRLLSPPRWQKWFMWWMSIWCQLSLLATIGMIFGCVPARASWDVTVTDKKCVSGVTLVNYCFYTASFCVFVDFYLSLYPTIVLLRLQMPIKKKLALCVALGLGWISGGIGIYKITKLPSLTSKDFSYDAADIVIWTIIEGSVIIIASTIPLLQRLLDLILRKSHLSYRHYRTSSSDGTNPPGRGGGHGPPQYFEDYSKESGRYEGIQLGVRKPKRKKRDEFGMTVLSTLSVGRTRNDNATTTMTSTAVSSSGGGGGGDDNDNDNDDDDNDEKEPNADTGSQEEILASPRLRQQQVREEESSGRGESAIRGAARQISGYHDGDATIKADRSSRQNHVDGQIVRTDVVMVEFDNPDDRRRGTTASQRWRPVRCPGSSVWLRRSARAVIGDGDGYSDGDGDGRTVSAALNHEELASRVGTIV